MYAGINTAPPNWNVVNKEPETWFFWVLKCNIVTGIVSVSGKSPPTQIPTPSILLINIIISFFTANTTVHKLLMIASIDINIFWFFKTDAILGKNIAPKKKYSHYSKSSGKSVYIDDIEGYMKLNEVQIGKFYNTIQQRAKIEKIFKITNIIVIIQLILSCIYCMMI